MSSFVQVLNPQNVERALGDFAKNVREKAMFAAVKEGGKELLQKTKETAIKNIGPGATSTRSWNKSIVDNFTIYFEPWYIESIVSVMPGFGHIYEKGTTDRFTEKGAYRGKIKAYNFFKETRETQQDAVLNTIMNVLDKEINQLKNK